MNYLSEKGKEVRGNFLNDLKVSGMSDNEVKELMEEDSSRSFINAFCEMLAN